MKNEIVKFLQDLGYEVVNYGTDSTESCHYPVYGEKVARAVVSKEVDLGIFDMWYRCRNISCSQ